MCELLHLPSAEVSSHTWPREKESQRRYWWITEAFQGLQGFSRKQEKRPRSLCGASLWAAFTKQAADAARALQISKKKEDNMFHTFPQGKAWKQHTFLRTGASTSSSIRSLTLLVSTKCLLLYPAIHHSSSSNPLFLGGLGPGNL